MKKLWILLLFASLLFSCNEIQKEKSYLSEDAYKAFINTSIDTLTVRNDTLMLGFVFGWTENQTKKHIKKLQNEGKLKGESLLRVGSLEVKFKFKGYQYDMFLGTKKYPTVISPNHENNRLVSLTIALYDEFNTHEIMEQLIDLYRNKYGDYLSEGHNYNENYFWIIQNMEITISHHPSHNIILMEYKDLVYEREKEIQEQKEQDRIDSLNREKSLNTVQDI